MRRLRQQGAFAERNHAGEFTAIGLPDIEVCFRGRYLAIEAKKDYPSWRRWVNGSTEEADGQKAIIQEIREAEGVAFCTWSWDDVAFAVEKIREGWESSAINALLDERQAEYVASKSSVGRRAVPHRRVPKPRVKATTPA